MTFTPVPDIDRALRPSTERLGTDLDYANLTCLIEVDSYVAAVQIATEVPIVRLVELIEKCLVLRSLPRRLRETPQLLRHFSLCRVQGFYASIA